MLCQGKLWVATSTVRAFHSLTILISSQTLRSSWTGIEGLPCRFVSDHEPRVMAQRPGNRHTLRLRRQTSWPRRGARPVASPITQAASSAFCARRLSSHAMH